jgi:chromosome segregation protein
MALKQIELIGFKSFAQKTTFDFSSGIAAIVGPNGSGKSNVIDAIRWILGERKAENIRGAKAEDLIFSGTPSRARVGMARVTITFDNRDKTFPSEYEEVAISRKVTRDGTSHYYLNEAEVRLKDIVAFFAESRLGTRGLTIVNQGNSDIFVRATPKERRTMIEEILGLRQYQLKKHEAERRLLNTKFNLEKVAAMVEELAPRLRLLKRQAARFEKQAELENELRELEKNYFGFRIGQLIREEEGLLPELTRVKQSLAKREAELVVTEQALKKVEGAGPHDQKSLADQKKKRNAIFEKRLKLSSEIARLDAKIEIFSTEVSTGASTRDLTGLLEEIWQLLDQFLESEDWARAEVELRPLLDRIEQILRGGDSQENISPDLEAAKEKLTEELQLVDEELKNLEDAEGEITGALEEFNQGFRKAYEAVNQKRNELRALEKEESALKLREERIRMKREELKHQAEQANRSLENFEAITSTLFDVQEAERRLFKLRSELMGIGEMDPALIREAKETEERHSFLTTQLEDLNKSSDDLAILIRDLDDKLHNEFTASLKNINDQFDHFFKLMFGGGRAHLKLVKPEPIAKGETDDDQLLTIPDDVSDAGHAVDHGGIEVEVNIPRKKIRGLEMLSGGERSLVSIAALFALISVSPPPFLVLDEVDAALDEGNAKRFADIVKDFSAKTQFMIVTHNRATMEAADILYGVTMGDDGTSKVVSLKLEQV